MQIGRILNAPPARILNAANPMPDEIFGMHTDDETLVESSMSPLAQSLPIGWLPSGYRLH
jgi:hypothetical protein